MVCQQSNFFAFCTHYKFIFTFTGWNKKSRGLYPSIKNKSKTHPGNYRRVSILTTVYTILERVTYNRIESSMKSEKLFIAFQSGFRSPFSTDTCLTHLTDQIRFRIDRCFYTGMVMIDLIQSIMISCFRNWRLLVLILWPLNGLNHTCKVPWQHRKALPQWPPFLNAIVLIRSKVYACWK